MPRTYTKRPKPFQIDKKGWVHLSHPRKRGLTRCRRSSVGMDKSHDPTLFVDCQHCKDLIRADVKAEMDGKAYLP